jgi:hypothetical protein
MIFQKGDKVRVLFVDNNDADSGVAVGDIGVVKESDTTVPWVDIHRGSFTLRVVLSVDQLELIPSTQPVSEEGPYIALKETLCGFDGPRANKMRVHHGSFQTIEIRKDIECTVENLNTAYAQGRLSMQGEVDKHLTKIIELEGQVEVRKGAWDRVNADLDKANERWEKLKEHLEKCRSHIQTPNIRTACFSILNAMKELEAQ